MAKKMDDRVIGKRFEHLTVLSYHHSTPGGSRCFLCRCDCGKECVGIGTKLWKRKGCGSCRKRLDPIDRMIRYMKRSYSSWAKRKGREFTLTDDQVKILLLGECYYCGRPPSQAAWFNNQKSTTLYNGIDRADNSKGYTPVNCVSCCKDCNMAKHSLSTTEFYSMIKAVYERRIKSTQFAV